MERYDERQKLERGKAFQWGFFACILTDAALCLLMTIYGVEFATYTLFIFAIWPPVTVCITQMILRDAFEKVRSSSGKVAVTVALLYGLLLVVRILVPGEALMTGGVLANGAAILCTGLCLTLIGVVYWWKQLWDWLHQKEE
ncbi:MAG: hypothetical protein LUD82_07530 [Clostridiales bacterium]|nr:hypothetical protein [Clostridiales bacterium]